jgi:hypothetical protein
VGTEGQEAMVMRATSGIGRTVAFRLTESYHAATEEIIRLTFQANACLVIGSATREALQR